MTDDTPVKTGFFSESFGYFVSAIRRGLNFRGRSRRKEFWWFVLFSVLITILGVVLSLTLDWICHEAKFLNVLLPAFWVPYLVVLFIASYAVRVRRLHDTDHSGWWILLGLIPIFGGLMLLYIYCTNSNPEANNYGPCPKSFEK